MIFFSPESYIADPGFPPLALRTDIAIQLFVIITILETLVMIIFSPRELRLRIFWITPLVNLISSCFLGPNQIFTDEGSLNIPAIFSGAQTVWEGQLNGWGKYRLSLVMSFILFVVVLGLFAIAIEGSLMHFAIQPSSKRLWKQVGLANAVSYLFLFGWSCWVGYILSKQAVGSSSDDFIDQLVDFVGRHLSEKGISRFYAYAWYLFLISVGVAILLACFGIFQAQKAMNKSILEKNPLKTNFLILIVMLIFAFIANSSLKGFTVVLIPIFFIFLFLHLLRSMIFAFGFFLVALGISLLISEIWKHLSNERLTKDAPSSEDSL